MFKIGLTGGIGSGKSFIGSVFQDLGCLLVQADKLGHQVLMPDGEAYQPTVDFFGDKILNEDKTINRKKLAAIVFGDPLSLKKLDHIVHPAVQKLSDELMAQSTAPMFVYEAAVLLEYNLHKKFDILIVAYCPLEMQIERTMARDNATREEVLKRIEHQMPMQDKLKHADYIINTSLTLDYTRSLVTSLYNSLSSFYL